MLSILYAIIYNLCQFAVELRTYECDTVFNILMKRLLSINIWAIIREFQKYVIQH